MAVQGPGTTWNLPNYAGELFTASPKETPLLSMIGGLTGGAFTTNPEFPTAQLYEYPDAEQPEISEAESATAPNAQHIDRNQEKNVVQIHQKTIDITYHKQASSGMMQGINTAGQEPDPENEKAWQTQHAMLIPTARDVEFSFIMGTYQRATSVNVPNKTRGMIELCRNFGTHIDGNGERLTYAMLQSLYKEMADNGAHFNNMVMLLPSGLKQEVSDIYGGRPGANLPATRTQGGIDIQTIVTDFTNINIAWNRFMPVGSLLLCDIRYMQPVFLEVPEKGVLFVEPLGKQGASDREQLYGEVGLDHGPGFLHGAITGLAA